VSGGIAQLFLNLGARRGVWSASRPGRLYPGKDPVPIVQEAGWAPELVWIGAENLAPPGFFFVKRVFNNPISHTTDSSWHSARYTKSTTRVVIEQRPQFV
jgi:hypothetical protein